MLERTSRGRGEIETPSASCRYDFYVKRIGLQGKVKASESNKSQNTEVKRLVRPRRNNMQEGALLQTSFVLRPRGDSCARYVELLTASKVTKAVE